MSDEQSYSMEEPHEESAQGGSEDVAGRLPGVGDQSTPGGRKSFFGIGRRTAIAIAAALGLLVCVAFAAGWGPFDRSDWHSEGQGSVNLRVNPGDSVATIGRTLVSAGSVRTVGAFIRAAAAQPSFGNRIQPGVYDMRLRMSAQSALARFFDPAARVQMRVLVADGKRASKIIASVANQTGLSVAALTAAADVRSRHLPPYASGAIEGFLYPATYSFDPRATADQVIDSIVANAISKHKALGLLAPPKALHISAREVLTLASILQVEAYPDDYAKVARVIYNRLHQSRRLQLDSTLNFALGTAKWTFTGAEHANPSAYNTFAHAGLPPGPIGNPGKAAIAAAMEPAAGDWIYFVTTNPDTGLTEFASTDSGFNTLREKFRSWLKARP